MSPDLERLERRVAELEDIARITELKLRYFTSCDLKRPDDVADCFMPDAIIDYENVGRFDLPRYLEVYRRFGCRPTQLDAHHGGVPSITITGPDSARGLWPLHYVGVDLETRTTRQVNGNYHDEYTRQGGRWRIRSTVLRLLSVIVGAVDDEGRLRVDALGRESAPPFPIG